jgi:hypothetical protein
LSTQSSCASAGADGEGEGETELDGDGEAEDEGDGETDPEGEGDGELEAQATTNVVEQTSVGSTCKIGAFSAFILAWGVDFGVLGLRTRYTIPTAITNTANIPSEISSVFFVCVVIELLLARLGHRLLCLQ